MQQAGVDIESSEVISSTSIRMATIMITTIPILVVYPFIQKYFVKDTLIGSVKG